MSTDAKQVLPRYLQAGREALVWKLDGLAETHRHAGHADIVRETIDGGRGLRPGAAVLPDFDAESWTAFFATVQQAADTFH
ncbi:MAG: hypothetical protein ACO3C1_13440 [Ilumatobacteraceae bacterium]